MKSIKWIFFDIGSTLVDESEDFRKRVEKTVANTNISCDDFYNNGAEIDRLQRSLGIVEIYRSKEIIFQYITKYNL